MENKELQQITEQISQNDFNRPFNDRIIFNPRLRTTGGRYIPTRRIIEINKKYYTELGRDELVGIIKHELCHYHLHIEGKPFHHRSAEFKKLLSQTNAPRFCERLPSEASQSTLIYQCGQCGMKYNRKRKLNTERYRCGKCRGEIFFIEKD
ncbi:SprT family protein [Halalkalibacillus halophilus]|uniref:SprT family protein n=1 Tax=Halalkalibacillus halophilus TaxID=392827 RepID=UPI00041D96DC|nr:SprT family protein [Halalkalibacillus halophilus]